MQGEARMAREYRIECHGTIDATKALELLSKGPYGCTPLRPFQYDEVWLSLASNPHRPDVRVFPEPFGFFVEVTTLPATLSSVLQDWIAGLRASGACLIIDNDTGAVVPAVH
jgi:hypothetical protein